MPKRYRFDDNSAEFKEFKSLIESKGWLSLESLPSRKAKSASELDAFMEKYDFSRPMINKRFKRIKNNNKTNNNTNQQQSYNLPNSNKKKSPKKKKKKSPKKKRKGVFNQPVSFRSIDDAIEDLRRTQSAIDAGDEITSLILDKKQRWVKLEASLIKALKKIITNQPDTKKGNIKCSNKFSKRKSKIIKAFSSKWDDCHIVGYFQHAVSAKALVLAKKFCRSLQIALGQTAGPLNINKIIINIVNNKNEIEPKDELAKQQLYYVAGWLLYASQKRASISNKNNILYRLLPELVSSSTTDDIGERRRLPSDLVQQV